MLQQVPDGVTDAKNNASTKEQSREHQKCVADLAKGGAAKRGSENNTGKACPSWPLLKAGDKPQGGSAHDDEAGESKKRVERATNDSEYFAV